MMKRYLLSAAIAALSVGSTATAQVPTLDIANVQQAVSQISHMLEDLGIQSEQLIAMQEQLALLQGQVVELETISNTMLESVTTIGMAMGGELDLFLERDWDSLMDAMDGLMMGDLSGLSADSAADIGLTYDQALERAGMSTETVQTMANSEEPEAQRVAANASTGAFMTAAAQESFGDAEVSLNRLSYLAGEIDEADTTKEAIDLNSRILVELGLVMTKMWELEAVQTVGAGQVGVVDAATEAAEREFFSDINPGGVE